ncbi:hypothetical protein DPMN_190176 [Dreissena polymorpha]|uniref:Uncharacterized protein n=1 Tax=Dreissena polymorpha TaxID=45954 RepID=A0A9D4DWA4_DREPO|nr:hypothetical protein DPMN_190176 [Dreissena polymorpha]
MGCYVVLSSVDADVEIVKETVKRSRRSTTQSVGEDIDWRILIMHYSERDNKTIYFCIDVNK